MVKTLVFGQIREDIVEENTLGVLNKLTEISGISEIIVALFGHQIKDEWIASNNYYWLQQLGFTLVAPLFEEE